MSDEGLYDAIVGGRQWAPWTTRGAADPDFAESDRQTHQALLTDADLLGCFRRQFPRHAEVDYDTMVRLLGYVWDCPRDRTANVTGYCCGCCGRTRAEALAGARVGYRS
jgi:hypothetical protein